MSIPFTYLIGWSQHNKWYYGVRYGKTTLVIPIEIFYSNRDRYISTRSKEYKQIKERIQT